MAVLPSIIDSIERAGVEARLAGHAVDQNPHLHASLSPAATGEPLVEWQEKVVAWRRGWERGGRERRGVPVAMRRFLGHGAGRETRNRH
jgi:hypothetical protein